MFNDEALRQAMEQLRLVRVETRAAKTRRGYVTIVEYHVGNSPNDAGHEETVHTDTPGITAEILRRTRQKAAMALIRVGNYMLPGKRAERVPSQAPVLAETVE